MNNEKWIIVTDIDGTIKPKNKQISTYTRDTFKKLSLDGHLILLATAKHPINVLKYQNYLGLSSPYIALNGSILSSNDGEYLVEKKFKTEDFHKIWNVVSRLPALILTIIPNGYVPWFSEHIKSIEGHPIQKTTFTSSDSVFNYIQQGVYRITLQVHGDDFYKTFNILSESLKKLATVTELIDQQIDISPLNVNKGYALNKLKNMKEYSYKRVIAFGNDANDIEMLEISDIGVTVNDASISAKNVADQFTLNCEEDGVAIWLREFFSLNL